MSVWHRISLLLPISENNRMSCFVKMFLCFIVRCVYVCGGVCVPVLRKEVQTFLLTEGPRQPTCSPPTVIYIPLSCG